jgi:uncharacterized protein YbjQ (UPF0145 family)
MAPAGSFESLAAALKGGCDSIYFGVTQLNMRSRAADNLTLADLAEVADICHTKEVKAYLAVNTLLYDHDTKLMRKIVDTAKENGIDAIIGFDFATLQYCNEIGMPVHVSVQFSVWNKRGGQRRYLLSGNVETDTDYQRVQTICNSVIQERSSGVDTSRGINYFYHPQSMEPSCVKYKRVWRHHRKHFKCTRWRKLPPKWAYNYHHRERIGAGVFFRKED